jgi:hypothetical protein
MSPATWTDDQALRELLAKIVRPVLADWSLDALAEPLLDVLVGLERADYSIQVLVDIVEEIADRLHEDEDEGHTDE